MPKPRQRVASRRTSKKHNKEEEKLIARKRGELLDRIRKVDPEVISGLTLETGAARREGDDGSFHDYFFNAGGPGADFIERFNKKPT